MKVTMRRKVETLAELMPKTEAVVELTILLDKDDFDDFANDLLEDRDFIKENVDKMYVDNFDVEHCILVTYNGSEHGILVQSEGYHYARYSAYFAIPEDYYYINKMIYPKETYDITDKNVPF